MEAFEAVIGLEIHAQLKTRSKVFCACSTAFGAPPNTNTCPVCLGLPGSLPVFNAEVARMAVQVGLATNCRIRTRSRFARKNYFYPDLPKGYQITQYDEPLCEGGHIVIGSADAARPIRINRIHLEEDAGKDVHDPLTDRTYLDLNRCGVPLIEIVSEPDLRSPAEAAAYVKELRTLLMYLDVCDGNMEEGSLRCDANVSVRPVGTTTLGTKSEVKNLNSFRFLERALNFEITRHIAALNAGQRILQETRTFDADTGETRTLRSKEEAHDYRYFPEPDLPPLVIDDALIAFEATNLPELPGDRRRRFMQVHGLPEAAAETLCSEAALGAYLDATIAAGAPAHKAANFILTEVLAALKNARKGGADIPVNPGELARLLAEVESGRLTLTMAKEAFAKAFAGESLDRVLAETGGQIGTEDALQETARAVIAAHPDEVARYRGGKTALLAFFVGQVMKATRGKANATVASDLLKRLLGPAELS